MSWRDRVNAFGWTHWVLIGLVLVMLAFEIYIMVQRRNGHWMPTESQVILNWVFNHPLIPLMIGILLGHWCWPQSLK